MDPNTFVDKPTGKVAMKMWYVPIASLNLYATAPKEIFYLPQM